MSDEIVDLSEMDSFYEAVDADELDEETAGGAGLRVPSKGVTARTASIKTANGTITSTILTWSEVGTVEKVGMKRVREDNPLRIYGAFNAWIRTKIARDAIFENTNRGRFPETHFLRFFPGLLGMSDAEMEQIAASAVEKSPLKYLKSRKIENSKAHRELGSLLIATGHGDRLTKGGGLRLPSVSDLLANEGAALKNIPIRILIQKGKPEWDGTIADHVVVGYKVL